MKPIILLGAAGTIGRVIAWDWLRCSQDHRIILADRDAVKQSALSHELGSRSPSVVVDLLNPRKLISLLKLGTLVINSTSHHFNLPVMEAALKAGCHYLDLGGLFHFTRRQLKLHRAFQEAGLTAVVGMGCSPGLTNLMARELTTRWEEVESIDIRVGGINHAPDSGAFPYAFGTLWEELTLKPALFDRGKWRYTSPKSGREIYRFPAPVGSQNLFYTLHSEVASLPVFFRDRGIRRVSFRIGLDPGLCRRVLKRDRPTIPKYRLRSLPPKDDEMALVEARGMSGGRRIHGRMICATRSEGEWSAGDINTACPASAVAALLLERNNATPGVYSPEDLIPWSPLQNSLLARGFRFVLESASAPPAKYETKNNQNGHGSKNSR